MFFSVLLFLISCLGVLGQYLYPWAGNKHEEQEKIQQSQMRVLDTMPNEYSANKPQERMRGSDTEKPDRRAGSHPLNGVQIMYPPDMVAEKKVGV